MYEPERQFITRDKLRDIVQSMARTLAAQLANLDRLAAGEKPATFLRYKELREKYLESRDLIDTMADRMVPVADMLPPNFNIWLVKCKLRALATYAILSDSFFKEPPDTVSRSLGAFEVLSEERASFIRTLGYFDEMLMEAQVDDKTADALEATRQRIERIIAALDLLLMDSPKQLTVFA
jgi:hypothetical protein